MGRTAPPSRILVEGEIERLRRVARRLRDPQARNALEEILDYAYKVLEAYRYEPMNDPLEPIIIGGLIRLSLACRENKNGSMREELDLTY